MYSKLILTKQKSGVKSINVLCFIITNLSFWGALISQPYISESISNKIIYIGLASWFCWIISMKYFSHFYINGELIVNTNSLKIKSNHSNLVLSQTDLIQVRIFYKNFKKKYELNGKSIEAQMTSTRDINKIKIKSTNGIYTYHFYLDDNNYFDELYELVKTMASNGLDIKILEGNNFFTKYIDEKI